MESQDLEFFEELIDSYQHQYDVGLRRIAATLAYMVQKDKPLQYDEELEIDQEPVEEEQPLISRERPAGAANLARYRIEVGRTHGVEPKHIVGAIANEANIKSRDIGQIKILNDHCLVDLPQNMPSATFRQLQKVWVCGQQLQISPADERFPSKAEKTINKHGIKRAEGKFFKPGIKKSPRSRHGGRKD